MAEMVEFDPLNHRNNLKKFLTTVDECLEGNREEDGYGEEY